jgi:aldehyde dehydrogenase (NAD+)
MRECLKFYIDGQWVDPVELQTLQTVNPATDEVSGTIALGSAADVDRAVSAARGAFPGWSQTSREQRLEFLERILEEYNRRSADLAAAITAEMGATAALAGGFQVGLGLGHLTTAIEVLKHFKFEELRGGTLIVKEPIGVCGLITPWNWPVNQVAVKVFPALATGCTMVLKPSQEAHFSAHVLAEIFAAAGVPAGVFNLVQGRGSIIGTALACHPEVDMVSITGSEAAGVQVAINAAPGVKRVCQELGGKSPNIILDDADTIKHVTHSSPKALEPES